MQLKKGKDKEKFILAYRQTFLYKQISNWSSYNNWKQKNTSKET